MTVTGRRQKKALTGPCRPAENTPRTNHKAPGRVGVGAFFRLERPAAMRAKHHTIILVPHARAFNHKGLGDFHMDRFGRLQRRGRSKVAPYVFTGIQLISKRLLRDAPEGPFSTNILWDRAIDEGRCFGAVHQGLWFDVGTPASVRATEATLVDA